MTVEIRELVIRATVDAPEGSRRVEAATGEPQRPAPGLTAAEREALVAGCVREVLRELRKSRGR